MILYDAIMVSLIVASMAVAVWAIRQMSRAAKEGKIRCTGKVKIERPAGVDKPK
jgi:hypothetical protein